MGQTRYSAWRIIHAHGYVCGRYRHHERTDRHHWQIYIDLLPGQLVKTKGLHGHPSGIDVPHLDAPFRAPPAPTISEPARAPMLFWQHDHADRFRDSMQEADVAPAPSIPG